MKRYNSRTKKNKTIIKIVCFLLIILFLGISIDNRLRPIVKEIAKNRAKSMAMIAIDNAVMEELSEIKLDYNSVVFIEKDENGVINSLKTDIVALNNLKARVTNNAIDKISKYDHDQIGIPIGTLLGSDLLSGRGPGINVNLTLSSNAVSTIESEFESAGINQTHHKINIRFKFSIYAVIIGYNTSVDIDTAVTVAESIIVGTTPDAFTNIEGAPTKEQLDQFYSFKAEAKK